jgi:cbb3-type cytochrome oxidase subunit 3
VQEMQEDTMTKTIKLWLLALAILVLGIIPFQLFLNDIFAVFMFFCLIISLIVTYYALKAERKENIDGIANEAN